MDTLTPGNADAIAPMLQAGVLGFKCFLVPSGVEEFPPVDEAAFISTNGASQYALAAIQNLSLIPEHRNDRGGTASESRSHRSP